MDVLVSIIVPAYNAERFLSEAIQSVLRQTLIEWELLIVDDGSTDNTLAIAQRYASQDARIRCLHQDNGGVSAARNCGIIDVSKEAEYVTFLEADDLWEPDALALLVAALEVDPLAVGAHGLVREIDSSGNWIGGGWREAWARNRQYVKGRKLLKSEGHEPTTFSCVVYDPCFVVGTIVVRRSTLTAAGLFDTSLTYAEDHDMWLRISRQGRLAYVDRVILSYRQHGASAMRNASDRSPRTNVRLRMLASPQISPEQKELLRRGVAFWYRYLSMQKFDWMLASLRERKPLLAAINMRHGMRNFFRYLVMIR